MATETMIVAPSPLAKRSPYDEGYVSAFPIQETPMAGLRKNPYDGPEGQEWEEGYRDHYDGRPRDPFRSIDEAGRCRQI